MPPNPTRFKYDLRGVEGGRQVLPAGAYIGKITSADITHPENKDERIELVVTVSGKYSEKDNEVHKYDLYSYIHTDSESAQNWKLREFLEAVGVISNGKGESGTLEMRKLLGKPIGVNTRVRAATAEYDEKAEVRKFFPADETAEAEVEDLDAEAEEPEAEGDETPYDDMSLGELRKEARGRGIKTVRLGAEDIIAALVEDDAAQEAEEAPEEEPEAEAEAEGLDLAGMSLNDLKKLAREHGIKTAGLKRKQLTDAIEEAMGGEEEPEEEEPEEEEEEAEEEEAEEQPADDYDEWEVDDLRIEAKDRSLSDRGGKAVLIARLRRDDAEGDNPF